MPDKKRRYESETGVEKLPRLGVHPTRKEAGEKQPKLLFGGMERSFAREVVLRLIDWVKQI